MLSKVKPNTPQWILRRFASRAVVIVDRHARIPAIGAHAYVTRVSAERFMRLFDRRHADAMRKIQEHEEGKAAVATVLTKIRAWAQLVANAIPALKIAEYGDRPDVPEDVIHDAERLLQAATDARGPDGGPLPFLELMQQDMQAAIDSANKEWDEASVATAENQELRSETRKAARAFELDLLALRAALKAELGSRHPDYHNLRRRKARSRHEDDDQVSLELLEQMGGEEEGEDEAEAADVG